MMIPASIFAPRMFNQQGKRLMSKHLLPERMLRATQAATRHADKPLTEAERGLLIASHMMDAGKCMSVHDLLGCIQRAVQALTLFEGDREFTAANLDSLDGL